MAQVRHVVLVGHCGADCWALRAAVEEALPGMAVESASVTAQLEPFVNSQSLLLINRILDGDLGTVRGLELIGKLAERPDPPVMILVSDYADAQEAAEAAGARPGFGKGELGGQRAAQRLRHAAGLPDAQCPTSPPP